MLTYAAVCLLHTSTPALTRTLSLLDPHVNRTPLADSTKHSHVTAGAAAMLRLTASRASPLHNPFYRVKPPKAGLLYTSPLRFV